MIYFDRGLLIQNFEDTIKLCHGETLKSSVKKSISETIIYNEEDYPALPKKRFRTFKISLNQYRTFEAAQIYKKKFPKSKIAVLNFASATNVGGSVDKGTKAQEESLCRCSTLYPVLKTENNLKNFYDYHHDRRDNAYTDRLIFTPNILVFKSDTDLPELLPEKDWFPVDVITCAAPNLKTRIHFFVKNRKAIKLKLTDDELYKIHLQRAKHILTVAAYHGADIFIGGAFGCGVFQNKPEVVSQVYKDIAAQFKGYFKEIVFAIYDPPKNNEKIFKAFNKIFNEGATK